MLLPSPSANATVDIETTRRQVAKTRVSFFIVFFVLIHGTAVAEQAQQPSDVIERAHNSTASNPGR